MQIHHTLSRDAYQVGIATTYASLIIKLYLASRDDSLLSSAEMKKLLAVFNQACESEKKHHIKYLAEFWYLLARLDMLFELYASFIAEEDSQQAAEQFTREQLALVEHVSPTPLPRMTLRLGKALGRNRQYDDAAECFNDIVESLSREEASFFPGGEQVRQEAISLRDKSISFADESTGVPSGSTTNQPKKGTCFIATAVYGSEFAPEVLILRRFRDAVLLQSRIGQRVVGFYYSVSPPLARLIGKNRFLKSLVKQTLIAPIVRMIERSSNTRI